MNIDIKDRAEILIEALPYIQQYNGKIIVVKYGGNAMLSEELKEAVMRDVVMPSLVGAKVVLIHGGGPEISDMLKKVGKKSEFVDGLRVTDEETVDIVQMVLSGKVNKSLVNLIGNCGGKAIGLCGCDSKMIKAVPLNDKLGYVGKVTEINEKPITDLLDLGYIPVISTVGCDDDGNIYKINADTAAAKNAEKLKAESFISMTDIRGVLKDKDDENSLIRVISTKDAPGLIEDGTINGGMIPKIQCCTEAIDNGVKKVFIIDGRVPHSILIEVLTDEGIGTMFI